MTSTGSASSEHGQGAPAEDSACGATIWAMLCHWDVSGAANLPPACAVCFCHRSLGIHSSTPAEPATCCPRKEGHQWLRRLKRPHEVLVVILFDSI